MVLRLENISAKSKNNITIMFTTRYRCMKYVYCTKSIHYAKLH